jgi:sugar phosphate isomerase/epimerase
MNHPMRDVAEEVRAFGALGFDFVDLTLEPERARPETLDVTAVAGALATSGLGVVGHTAWYLPIASPFPSLLQMAVDELRRAFDVFARLGVAWVNVHPDQRVPSVYPREWVIERNRESLATLAEDARQRGLGLMLENVPGPYNGVETLRGVFSAVPTLGWHLDVGHANLGVPANVTGPLLDAFADRLRHVHVSDNRGGDADLHLPIGAGTIDWKAAIGHLKRHGYDGTITLEVFSPDRDYLAMSREKVRRLWDET